MVNFIHFDKLDSTSTYLKNNYEKYNNLTFVSADYQENGHGRNNRIWISNNKENLLFSLLIKDKEIIKKYSSLSLASAVCIYEVLKQLNINNVSIKWPNDVYVNDKKIAGILLESVSFSDNMEALIIGVGLNVNTCSFPNNIENTPTSIYLETNIRESLDKLKEMVYEKFIDMTENIKIDNTNYLNTVRNNNYLKDKTVYANIKNQQVEAQVLDVNEDNTLKLKVDNDYINVYSGEISVKKNIIRE